MATPAPRPDLGEMYEPETVADALNVGRETVYRLIRKGELKACKIGGQYRIPEVYLNEFLGPDLLAALHAQALLLPRMSAQLAEPVAA